MRRWIGLLFLLALASAQVVREGWVRFSPGPNAAAYLTLENPGDLPLRLVGARTPVTVKTSACSALGSNESPWYGRKVEPTARPSRRAAKLPTTACR